MHAKKVLIVWLYYKRSYLNSRCRRKTQLKIVVFLFILSDKIEVLLIFSLCLSLFLNIFYFIFCHLKSILLIRWQWANTNLNIIQVPVVYEQNTDSVTFFTRHFCAHRIKYAKYSTINIRNKTISLLCMFEFKYFRCSIIRFSAPSLFSIFALTQLAICKLHWELYTMENTILLAHACIYLGHEGAFWDTLSCMQFCLTFILNSFQMFYSKNFTIGSFFWHCLHIFHAKWNSLRCSFWPIWTFTK